MNKKEINSKALNYIEEWQRKLKDNNFNDPSTLNFDNADYEEVLSILENPKKEWICINGMKHSMKEDLKRHKKLKRWAKKHACGDGNTKDRLPTFIRENNY